MGRGVEVVGSHHNLPASFWMAAVDLVNDDGDVEVERVVVVVVAAVEAGDVVVGVVAVDDVAGRCFAGVEHGGHVELVPLAYLAQYLLRLLIQ